MSFRIVKLVDPIQLNLAGGLNFQGDYDNATAYVVGDVVTYNGSSYAATQGTTGNLPTDVSNWQLLAEKGDPLTVNAGTNIDIDTISATEITVNTVVDDDAALTANSATAIASQKATKSYADTKVTSNASITGATKTKITYDAKGLVTAGADATTADISDSLNKRYVTDANLTTIGNQSGTNTGDNATNTQYSGLDAAKVNKAGDTMTGDLNMGTNKLIGGTGVTDVLKLQGTTGNGTAASAAIQLLTGNNGATTALTVLNNGNVGMGTTSPVAKLQVDTVAAGTIGQIIRGASAQTADLLQLQNSSGTVLSKFTSAGNLLLPGGSSGTPSLSFTSDPNSGFYSIAPNYFGVSVANSLVTTYQNNAGRKGTVLYGNTYSGTVANAVLTLSTDSSILATHSIDQTNKRYLIQPYESGISYDVPTILNSLGGNVGIGTTSPSAKLQVDTSAATTIGQIIKGASAQTADLLQIQNSAAAVLFDVTAAGRVGIGTANPSVLLHVRGALYSASFPANVEIEDSAAMAQDVGGGFVFSGNDGTTGGRWWAGIRGAKENATSGNYAGYVSILTRTSGVASMTERMRVSSAGNVGIGTTAPSEKLDVSGTVKATGYKSSDGSAGVSGSFTTTDGKTITIKDGLVVSIV